MTRREEERVEAILARVRREVALRDVLTFALVRAWLGLLLVGARLYAGLAARRRMA